MSATTEMAKAGYQRAEFSDATEPVLLTIPEPETRAWAKLIKGSTIGDACNCVGARCVKWSIPGVEWVWLGASIAFVAYKDGRRLRYGHTGIVPRTQDKGFYPPSGTFALKPLPPAQHMDAPRAGRATGKGTVPAGATGTKSRAWSVAAKLRAA